MRRAAFTLLLVGFVFSCGGQWAFLQGVAWANMIREYSAIMPLAQAVQMTMSGQYPCPLCKAIAARKKSEDSKIAVLFQHEKKIVSPVLLVASLRGLPAPRTFAAREPVLPSRSDAPPTPPPRFV